MKFLNLGIVAHVDAGKTSLTERLLFDSGVLDRMGRVDDGDTQTDSLALERERGITIRSAVVSFDVGDVSVNLLDTPGHPDFIAEVERVLGVLDAAVLVVSAVEGVQPQTRVLMRTLQRLRIPTVIFVNKIDRAGARGVDIIDEIGEHLDLTGRGDGRRSATWAPARPRSARGPCECCSSWPSWPTSSPPMTTSCWPATSRTSQPCRTSGCGEPCPRRRSGARCTRCSSARPSPARECRRYGRR